MIKEIQNNLNKIKMNQLKQNHLYKALPKLLIQRKHFHLFTHKLIIFQSHFHLKNKNKNKKNSKKNRKGNKRNKKNSKNNQKKKKNQQIFLNHLLEKLVNYLKEVLKEKSNQLSVTILKMHHMKKLMKIKNLFQQ